jgi:acetaldehyde dehydrogenase (acetylating)
VLEDPEIKIVFDATSAKAHVRHAKALREAGCIAVDLTPAARGPYVVPPANLAEHLDKVNINMVTCGGQATTPMIYAVSRVTPVRYAEMVSTIASLSAGPGTRQNIDEFTETTSTALAVIGRAQQGKAIIILNPADPPIMMRNTVYAIPERDFDPSAVIASIERMVVEVQEYVPGYHLKSPPVFDMQDTPWGKKPVVVMLPTTRWASSTRTRRPVTIATCTTTATAIRLTLSTRTVVCQSLRDLAWAWRSTGTGSSATAPPWLPIRSPDRALCRKAAVMHCPIMSDRTLCRTSCIRSSGCTKRREIARSRSPGGGFAHQAAA